MDIIIIIGKSNQQTMQYNPIHSKCVCMCKAS